MDTAMLTSWALYLHFLSSEQYNSLIMPYVTWQFKTIFFRDFQGHKCVFLIVPRKNNIEYEATAGHWIRSDKNKQKPQEKTEDDDEGQRVCRWWFRSRQLSFITLPQYWAFLFTRKSNTDPYSHFPGSSAITTRTVFCLSNAHCQDLSRVLSAQYCCPPQTAPVRTLILTANLAEHPLGMSVKDFLDYINCGREQPKCGRPHLMVGGPRQEVSSAAAFTSRSLTANVTWPTSSRLCCHDFSTMLDCTLGLCAKIKSSFLRLLWGCLSQQHNKWQMHSLFYNFSHHRSRQFYLLSSYHSFLWLLTGLHFLSCMPMTFSVHCSEPIIAKWAWGLAICGGKSKNIPHWLGQLKLGTQLVAVLGLGLGSAVLLKR